jgi:hypothetical protein
LRSLNVGALIFGKSIDGLHFVLVTTTHFGHSVRFGPCGGAGMR